MEENVDKAFAPDLKGQDYSGRRYGYKIPHGYEFDKIDRGEIILKPKGPFIPKTFEECCEVLKIKPSSLYKEHHENVPLGYVSKMDNLYKLIICKNAYDKLFKRDIDPDSEIIGSVTIPVNSELTLTFPNSWVVDEFYRVRSIIENFYIINSSNNFRNCFTLSESTKYEIYAFASTPPTPGISFNSSSVA